MAFERFWKRQDPIAFTADGGQDGLVTVASVECLKVKQEVKISAVGLPDKVLEVKKVISPTQLYVGPRQNKTQKGNRSLLTRTDISAYTTALSATISSKEQSKQRIKPEDIINATYEQEPTVAWRVHSVDKWGREWDTDNPFPVQLSDGDINIGTVEANIEVHTTHLDDSPETGRVHDSMRIGGGQFEAEVDSDENLHTEMHGNDAQGVDRVVKTSTEGEVVTAIDLSENTLEERNFGVTSGLAQTQGTVETDFMLLRNPLESGIKLRIYKSRRGVETANAGSIVRTYIGPTVDTLGTPLSIFPAYIKSPLPVSSAEVYFLPIISNRGSLGLVTIVPRANSTVIEDFKEQITIDPGFDVLFTVQNDNNNVISHLDIFWSEV